MSWPAPDRTFELEGSLGYFGGIGSSACIVTVEPEFILVHSLSRGDHRIEKARSPVMLDHRFLWMSRFSWTDCGRRVDTYLSFWDPSRFRWALAENGWALEPRGWRAFTWAW